MRSLIRLGVVLVALAWIFLVTFNYYIVHKPFGVENALAILSALGGFGGGYVLVPLVVMYFLARWNDEGRRDWSVE